MVFNPADIIAKLKLLFIVVISLFGVMCVGAVVGFVQDTRDRRAYVTKLQSPDAGFFLSDKGTWLWRFTLSPLRGEIDAPQGSAVTLAGMLGVPMARLRSALPDELLSWDLAASLGRRHGLSRKFMNETLEIQRNSMPRLVSVPKSLRRHSKHHVDVDKRLHEDGEDELLFTSDEEVLLEEFVGTALVLGFLQAASLLPVAELGQRISEAKAYFGSFLTPAGWDFAKTQTDFVTLLSPGVLNGTNKWLIRCRLWRLILSQSAQGYWDASTTTAFALEARDSKELKELKPTLKDKLLLLLGGALEILAYDDDDDTDTRHESDATALEDFMDVVNDTRNERQTRSSITSIDGDKVDDIDPNSPRLSSASRSSLPRRSVNMARAAALKDCPVTFSMSAISRSVPRELAQLRADDPSINVVRVWTTMMCITVLEKMINSWIFGDGDLYPEKERTIVDAAREWIEAYADEHPALESVLADGSVQKFAGKVTLAWHRAAEERTTELRHTRAMREQMHRSHVHRTATSIVRAITNQHGAGARGRCTLLVYRWT